MTKEEILNMPAGPEIDALFAEKVMGWHETNIGLTWERAFYWTDREGKRQRLVSNFNPSINISHAFEGEEKVKPNEMHRYTKPLTDIIKHDTNFWPITFQLVHATPHQRTRALILWAMEKEATNEVDIIDSTQS